MATNTEEATTRASSIPVPSSILSLSRSPTLLSGQQRQVHVLDRMQERGGSGLQVAGS